MREASLEQLVAALKSASGFARAPAPVENWTPRLCGEADIRIARDGSWRHEGVRITREPLVRLFASILRKDADGETYLVTPAEKLRIVVEDAPFLAVRADRAGVGADQVIVFTTNVGDVVAAGPDRPIRVETDPATGEPRPYVLVRGGLEARILRAPYYQLAEWAEPRGGALGVWSGGAFFALGQSR